MIYGLGMQELLVILAIVMLLFGGKKLPEVGKNLGKAIRGFKESEEETTKELKAAAEKEKAAGEANGEEEASSGPARAEEEEEGDGKAERPDDPSTPRPDSGQAGTT